MKKDKNVEIMNKFIFLILIINPVLIYTAAHISGVKSVPESSSSDSITHGEKIISKKSLWFEAVILNSIELVELLSDEDQIDINEQDSNGNTALHLAALNNHTELVKLLIEKQINFELLNNEGKTAFQLAQKNGNSEVVKILNIYVPDNDSLAAMFLIGLSQPKGDKLALTNSKIVKKSRSPSSKTESKVSNSPNGLIAKDYKCYYCSKEFETLIYLNRHIKNGHVYICSWFSSVISGQIDKLIKILSQNRIDINLKNELGNTAMHIAMHYNNMDIAILLIKQNANLSIVNNLGNTPLHVAVYQKYKDLVKLLINSKADLSIINKEGKTAQDLAAQLGYTEIEEILKQAKE